MNDEVKHPNHYARLAIEPDKYIDANNFGFRQGNVIKYVSRFDFKDGLKDLIKARENLDRMIEKEKGKEINNVKKGFITIDDLNLKEGFKLHRKNDFIKHNEDLEYRPLLEEEILQYGDEFYDEDDKKWIPTTLVGDKVAGRSGVYRTKRQLPDNLKS